MGTQWAQVGEIHVIWTYFVGQNAFFWKRTELVWIILQLAHPCFDLTWLYSELPTYRFLVSDSLLKTRSLQCLAVHLPTLASTERMFIRVTKHMSIFSIPYSDLSNNYIQSWSSSALTNTPNAQLLYVCKNNRMITNLRLLSIDAVAVKHSWLFLLMIDWSSSLHDYINAF